MRSKAEVRGSLGSPLKTRLTDYNGSQEFCFSVVLLVQKIRWEEEGFVVLLGQVLEWLQLALFLIDPVFGWDISWRGCVLATIYHLSLCAPQLSPRECRASYLGADRASLQGIVLGEAGGSSSSCRR